MNTIAAIQRFAKPAAWVALGAFLASTFTRQYMLESTGAAYLLVGLSVAYLISLLLGQWRNDQKTREFSAARQLLKEHGYYAHLYSPLGHIKDTRLVRSMGITAQHGYIILDKEHRVVGRVLPRVEKRPHLTLVDIDEHPTSKRQLHD
ncbi:MAG: hypothetical protein ACR2PS_03095 [Pseudomonadales bacterium]